MLSALDGRFFARCDGCIASWPSDVERRARDLPHADVVRELVAVGWEVTPNDMAYCLECSRRRREVQPRPTSRGVHRRRR